MEKYHCLQCYFTFERMYPAMVKCPKCQHKYVFWETSPFISPYVKHYLPKEVITTLESNNYKFITE